MEKLMNFSVVLWFMLAAHTLYAQAFMTISSSSDASTHGLYVFDYEDGNLTLRSRTESVERTSYHNWHPNRPWLYAVGDDQVYAFRFDAGDGTLHWVNSVSSEGRGPCYVSVDQSGRYVFVANYGGGSIAVYKIREDGGLHPSHQTWQHHGSSVDSSRQRAAHPHLIIPSPDNRFVLVPDLGLDAVVIYAFDVESGLLARHGKTRTPPGAGPRHMEFHPSGLYAYVLYELSSGVGAYRWDSASGSLLELEHYPLLPPDFEEFNKSADIHLTSDGQWLYGTNRGHNSITGFSVQPDGLLEKTGHFSGQGDWPRNFFITPDDQYLFLANRQSDHVVRFSIGSDTGALSPGPTTGNLPGALCIKMWKP